MKNHLLLLLAFFCQVFLIYPSYGVYLNYEDEGKSRTIRVYFGKNYDDKENKKRIDEKIIGKGLSFTETETIKEKKKIFFSYTKKEKDFFTSPLATKFINWIDEAQELRSLQFLGVDGDTELVSMEKALRLIVSKCAVFSEVDDFCLVSNDPIDDFYLIPNDPPIDKGHSLYPIIEPAEKKGAPLDMWAKFKKALIICKGKKKADAYRKINNILKEYYEY